MILGIVGEKLSGKDSVAEYVTEKYGAVQVRTSKILDELLHVLELPITRRNEIDAGIGMEKMFGPKIIGEAVMRRVQKMDSDLIIINGIRQQDQLDNAKAIGAKIIYITAPAEIRYQRAQQRNQKEEDRTQTFEQFLEQDKEWIEVSIPQLGAQADVKIENIGTIEELHRKIDEIIREYKK